MMQALLLHDIRQLRLTNAFLQAGVGHHPTTLPRSAPDSTCYNIRAFA